MKKLFLLALPLAALMLASCSNPESGKVTPNDTETVESESTNPGGTSDESTTTKPEDSKSEATESKNPETTTPEESKGTNVQTDLGWI